MFDAKGGCHKIFANKSFDKWPILPEEEKNKCSWVSTHKVKDCHLLSLSEIVYSVLGDEDYVCSTKSHTARKKKHAKCFIS